MLSYFGNPVNVFVHPSSALMISVFTVSFMVSNVPVKFTVTASGLLSCCSCVSSQAFVTVTSIVPVGRTNSFVMVNPVSAFPVTSFN